MPKAFELENGDEMTKKQVFDFYLALLKSVFEKDLTPSEQEKFWNQCKKAGIVNSEDRLSIEELIKILVEEWKGMTPMLQDLEVTVFEVEETFPTMYNMQKIVKRLVSRISGVE